MNISRFSEHHHMSCLQHIKWNDQMSIKMMFAKWHKNLIHEKYQTSFIINLMCTWWGSMKQHMNKNDSNDVNDGKENK